MYYPDELIERVRSSNDIVDIIGSYVHLKKQGRNYFGLCPFHNEKSPSFSVNGDKQIFHCFGCGVGGNVITFLMKYENYTFPEAVKALADRAGIPLPEAGFSEEMKKAQERRSALFSINKETATYYYRLLRSPKGEAGMRYLEGRALSRETMQRFGLGYADGRNSDLTAFLREKGYSDELILASGVAVFDEKRGLHDKFWNRVIFPIQDVNHRVIGFGGRVMGDGKPKYLNSPETEIFDKGRNLYGLNLAKQSRQSAFILCEGYMDVIAMHQAGFTQAAASLGTSFTSGQAAVLKRYVREVLLAYDSDGAGVRAALRNIGILREAGLRARVIDLSPHKDPDEFMKALGREAFEERIRNAENAFYYELRMAERDYDLQDPGGRTDFCREAARRLSAFEDEIERENYLRSVAARYFMDEDALRRMVGAYGLDREESVPGTGGRRGAAEGVPGYGGIAGAARRALNRGDPAAVPGTGAAGPGRESGGSGEAGRPADPGGSRDEALLITWLTEDPSLFPGIRRYLKPEDFTEGICRQVAERLFGDLERNKAPDPGSCISMYTDEEEQRLASALFVREMEIGGSDRKKALKDLVYSVKKASVDRMSRSAPGDAAALVRTIQAKKELQELRKADIDK